VFEPGTGDVLGIITSRTSDRRGGFADSGALVVVPFLQANHIAAVDVPAPRVVRAAPVAHAAAPVAHATPAALAMPAVHVTPAAVAVALPPLPRRALAEPLPLLETRAQPVPTMAAVVTVSAPRDDSGAVISWQAPAVTPKQFVYTRHGCRIAVTIDVRNLQFVVAHQALVAPHHRGALLGITLQQRAPATDACADVAASEPAEGAYDATAMSFNGRHVTMRFVYSGDPDNSDAFPSDASLDADLGGDAVTATVSFFAADWTGSIQLPLTRTASSSVSSNW
jgi:hypothetical protein